MLLKWLTILLLTQFEQAYAWCPTWITYATQKVCLTPTKYQDFTAAQQYCRTLGANLATFYSYQEYSEVYFQVTNSCALVDYYLLGYTDVVTEGTFRSMANNDRNCFERYYIGQPNNANDQDCMAFQCGFCSQPDGDGTVNDIACMLPDPGYGVCQIRTTTPTISNVTCPSGWTAVGRYCYKRMSSTATFTAAQTSCPCGSTLPILKCAFDYEDFVNSAYWQTTLGSSTNIWLNMRPVGGVTTPTNPLDYEWLSSPTERLIYSRWDTDPAFVRSNAYVRITGAGDVWDTESNSSPQSVVCQLNPAGNLCSIPNASMTTSGSFTNSQNWATIGCSVTYTCIANAFLVSDMSTTKTFICQASLTWDKLVEPCLVMCPAISVTSSLSISNPGNSTIANKYWPSTTVYFSCTNASYYIINPSPGNATTCLSNGTWSIQPSTFGCLSTCDIPPKPYPLNYSMPPLESNGRIAPGRTITSQYCTDTVNYYLPATVTATCLSNGTWNTPLPSCIPRCRAISAAVLTARNLAATYSDATNYALNSNVSFACSNPSQYALIGPTVAQCNSSSLWNNTIPTCQLTCPAPVLTQPLIKTPNGTGPGGRFIGPTTVTFSCNASNYVLVGQQLLTCMTNGSWSDPFPTCIVVCPAISVSSSLSISNPGNSTIANRYWPSTTVDFSCTNASYYIINPLVGNTTTCLSNGTWSTQPSNIGCLSTCDIPPTPYPMNYSMPALESNGRIAPGRTITNQFCTDVVNYYLPATVTATCLSNGTWNIPLPLCIPRCQAITAGNLTARNLAATYSDTTNYGLNSSVSFACSNPSLYTLIGPSVAHCNSTFLWNNTIPSCQLTCPVPVLTQPAIYAPNGTGPGGRFIGPTAVTFSCNASNYELVGQGLLTCTTSGSWSDAFPTCIATCPPLTVTSGVEITYADSKKKMNSTAQFSCDEDSELKGATTAICGMDHLWELSPDEEPSCKENPDTEMDILSIVQITIQTLGCTFLIGAASVAIGVTLTLRDFSIEALLHMSQELAIIIAHVLILTLRDRTNPWELCTTVATLLQLAFVTLFTFLTIEAVHSYTFLSNVLNNGSLVSRKVTIGIGCAIPTVYTATTAAIFYKDYALSYGCWLNWGNTTVASLTMGPIILCTVVTVISTEAGGSFRMKALPLMDKHQLFAARVNQNAMWFLLSGHWVSWFMGSYAIYAVHIAWIVPVFVANVVLGVMIFVFHVMGSPEANKLVRKWWRRCCNKKTA